jgi:hypothetical protein
VELTSFDSMAGTVHSSDKQGEATVAAVQRMLQIVCALRADVSCVHGRKDLRYILTARFFSTRP